jgi:hypothetical protein
MTRRLLVALAAGVAALGVGCGGDDMTQFEGNGIAFTHPAGWSRVADVEEQDRDQGIVAAFQGDSGVDGAPVRVVAFNQPREPGTLAQYGKEAASTRPLQAGGPLVEDGKVDVTGADGAWRVVVDYRMRPESGGEPVPARSVDILPVKDDRQYRLTITGPRDAVESTDIDKLIDSFEITSKPAT